MRKFAVLVMQRVARSGIVSKLHPLLMTAILPPLRLVGLVSNARMATFYYAWWR